MQRTVTWLTRDSPASLLNPLGPEVMSSTGTWLWPFDRAAHGRDQWKFGLAVFPLFLFFSNFWQPNFIDIVGGDSSLTFAMQYAFSNIDELIGQGIHTTGRWSILYWNNYWPDTYLLYVLGHALVVAIPYSLLLRNLGSSRAPLWLALALTVLFALILARSTDARFLLVAATTIWTVPDFRERRSDPLLLGSLAVLALAAHVKATFLAVAIAVGVGIAIREILARRFPVHAVWLLSWFVGWAAVGGIGWTDIEIYVTHGLFSNEGYGDLFFDPARAWPMVAIIVGGLIAMAGVAQTYRTRGWDGLVPMVLWSFLLFVAFKTAVIRPDGQHLLRFTLLIVSLAILAFAASQSLLLATERVVVGRWGLAALGICLAAGVTLLTAFPRLSPVILQQLAAKSSNLVDELHHVANFFGGKMPQLHTQAKALVRDRTPLPVVSGPVAFYGIAGSSVPLSYDMDVRFLPILAPSEVWSASALARNVAYVRDPAAPRHLLLLTSQFLDGVSVAIAENYAPVSVHGPFLLMERRATPPALTGRVLQEQSVHWGEAVSVPKQEGRITILEYDFSRSLLGRLLSTVYRSVPVRLEMMNEKGEAVLTLALARSVGLGGIVVSPTPSSMEEVANILSRGCRESAPDEGPTMLRFVAGDSRDWLFSAAIGEALLEKDVRIRLYSLGVRSAGPDSGATACK